MALDSSKLCTMTAFISLLWKVPAVEDRLEQPVHTTLEVTLSNLELPIDSDGHRLLTGEVQVYDNHKRDGYWYLYISDWGCCRQVDCCTNSGPWPTNQCWQCCDQQKHSPCTYATNHSIISYRTRNFTTWENLGALITSQMRYAGTVFVPRVVYNAVKSKYVMWFENYNASYLPSPTNPNVGHYSVATSDSPSGPFSIIYDYPNSATFKCGGSQGDFDIMLDDDGTAYIVTTYYSHFCIEQLSSDFTGGTGKTTKVIAMDPTIKGHPPGDEAPTLFKRNGEYILTYASGCCGCKGGSVTWEHRASHPLGTWSSPGILLTPKGPTSRAQQRSVFTVPTSVNNLIYINVGNQWVPGKGGEGTCSNGGLLYWWILNFDQDGNVLPLEAYQDNVTFMLEL